MSIARTQMLKMFHLGRNLELTYSVMRAFRQNASQTSSLRCMLNPTRSYTYGPSSKHISKAVENKVTDGTEQKTQRKQNRKRLYADQKIQNRVLSREGVKQNNMFLPGSEDLIEGESFGSLSENKEKAQGLKDKTMRQNNFTKHKKNLFDTGKRLHSRVLSEKEILENELYRKRTEGFSEEDSFGTMLNHKGKHDMHRDKTRLMDNVNRKVADSRVLSEKEILGNELHKKRTEAFSEEDFFGFGTMSNHKGKHDIHRDKTRLMDNVNRKVADSRVLSEKEILGNELHKKRTGGFSEEDSFGTMSNHKGKHDIHRDKTRLMDNVNCKVDILHADDKMHKSHWYDKDGEMYHKRNHSKSADRRKDKFADTFGTLESTDNDEFLETVYEESEIQDDRDDDKVTSDRPHRRLIYSRNNRNHLFYARKIIRKGKQGKVSEAISILEDRMLVEDRVMPSAYVFTLVIGICGRVGYTKKAFALLKKMQDMGFQPQDPTYTALFNACSNSPWKHDGLERAQKLRESMLLGQSEPSLTRYKAMIKAFGVCGDMKTAFILADEACRKFKVDSEFFSFLFMAVISDKEAGFRHAIQVWKMMRKGKIQPTIFHYNLMLRVVKECSIGDQDFIKDFIPLGQSQVSVGKDLNHPAVESQQNMKKYLQEVEAVERAVDTSEENYKEWWQYENIRKGNNEKQTSVVSVKAQPSNQVTIQMPDILNPQETYKGVISLGEINSAEDRMLLLGGMMGYLSRMKKDGITADIITFTQLLDVIPQTVEAESKLFEAMEIHHVKADIDFFSLLIRKRCFRNKYDDAKDVTTLIKDRKLKFNLRTYCCLAMTCFGKHDAETLFQNMEDDGIFPTIEVMGTLIKRSNLDLWYKMYILKKMEHHHVKPDEMALKTIESQLRRARDIIVKNEREKPDEIDDMGYILNSSFKKFKDYYESWLQRMEVDKPDHPWATFRSKKSIDTSTDVIEM